MIFLAIVTFCAAKGIDKIKAINNIGGIFTLAIAIGFTVVSFIVYALFCFETTFRCYWLSYKPEKTYPKGLIIAMVMMTALTFSCVVPLRMQVLRALTLTM